MTGVLGTLFAIRSAAGVRFHCDKSGIRHLHSSIQDKSNFNYARCLKVSRNKLIFSGFMKEYHS